MKAHHLIVTIVFCFIASKNYAQVNKNITTIPSNNNPAAVVAPCGSCPIVVVPIADRVIFSYDESGNQRERKLCINCADSRPAAKSAIDAEKKVDTIIEDDLKFYPNPVTEDLFIEFNIADVSKKINNIEILDLNGQIVKMYNEINLSETLKIPFADLPQGIYILNINYSNGEVVDLKIVKK